MQGMRVLIALGMALALAGCGGSDGKRDESDNRAAEGEVLGGTISDDMLPLEAVQSQSPTLKAAPSAIVADEDGTDAAESTGEETAPAPEPVASGAGPAE